MLRLVETSWLIHPFQRKKATFSLQKKLLTFNDHRYTLPQQAAVLCSRLISLTACCTCITVYCQSLRGLKRSLNLGHCHSHSIRSFNTGWYNKLLALSWGSSEFMNLRDSPTQLSDYQCRKYCCTTVINNANNHWRNRKMRSRDNRQVSV